MGFERRRLRASQLSQVLMDFWGFWKQLGAFLDGSPPALACGGDFLLRSSSFNDGLVYPFSLSDSILSFSSVIFNHIPFLTSSNSFPLSKVMDDLYSYEPDDELLIEVESALEGQRYRDGLPSSDSHSYQSEEGDSDGQPRPVDPTVYLEGCHTDGYMSEGMDDGPETVTAEETRYA